MKRAIHALCASLALCAPACKKQEDRAKPPADPVGQGKVETTKSPERSKQDADRFAAVTIKTTPVAGPVYMLEGAGGNIGASAGEDGVLLIDDQFAPLAPRILEAVRALGKGEPRYVVNTHWHGDHTGGNPELGRKSAIVAHENVRKRLSTPQARQGETVGPMDASGLPTLTFKDTVSLHMNGEEVRVVHFATGHTDTDSIVFFTRSNVVHMGDHFFNGKFPFIDTESGGDPVQYTKNVKAVLDQIDESTRIIPGHGALGGKADLAAFHAMLVETMDVVQKAKKAGKSLAEAQKAGLPAKFASWDGGYIKLDTWIKTLYDAKI